jgi:hypothetical protein
MNTTSLLKKAGWMGTVLPAPVVIALALAGCAGSQVTGAPSSTLPPVPPTIEPATNPPTNTTRSAPLLGTLVVLEFAGREIAGELDSSATSLSLLAQLPLTLSFRDYSGQEKFAEIPVSLDLTGAPEGSTAAPMTIGYYVPDQHLILYYAHVGYFDGIVPIGTYDDASAVESQSGDFTGTLLTPQQHYTWG